MYQGESANQSGVPMGGAGDVHAHPRRHRRGWNVLKSPRTDKIGMSSSANDRLRYLLRMSDILISAEVKPALPKSQ